MYVLYKVFLLLYIFLSVPLLSFEWIVYTIEVRLGFHSLILFVILTVVQVAVLEFVHLYNHPQSHLAGIT